MVERQLFHDRIYLTIQAIKIVDFDNLSAVLIYFITKIWILTMNWDQICEIKSDLITILIDSKAQNDLIAEVYF